MQTLQDVCGTETAREAIVMAKDVYGWVILAIFCVVFPAIIPIGILGLIALAFSSGFKRDGKPNHDEWY